MKTRLPISIFIVVVLFILSGQGRSAIHGKIPYNWKNVAIGGGGSVPGMIIHPHIPNLVYIRTDIGSVYRWDADKAEWHDIWDWPSSEEWNLTAVASFAVPPSDTTGNIIFAAAGKYAAEWAVPQKGGIYKSTDRGETWKRIGPDVYMASDWDQRFGERLGIDPHDPNHIYLATRMQGLLKSIDGGESWKTLGEAPAGKSEPNTTVQNRRGLTFIVFDSRSGELGNCCKTLYLGSWYDGVYRSTDSGETWSLIPGSPNKPYRAAVDETGQLYVAHRNGLIKFDGAKWTDITPSSQKDKRFTAIALDPGDHNHLLTAPHEWAHNLPILRSTDGGATWRQIRYEIVNDIPWRPASHWASAIFCLVFDPHNPKRAGYSDWYHPWMTPDITADTTQWYTFEKGRESLYPLCLTSPSYGKVLLYSGIPDIGGFDHTDLNTFPEHTVQQKGLPDASTTGIDYAANDPEFAIRVVAKDWGQVSDYGCGYTYDAGGTWDPMLSKPFEEATGGRVAVSATGDRVVWMPQESCMFYTKDLGRNWLETYGAPENVITRFNSTDLPLASDRVLNNVFYIYADGKFYRSDNGAEIWRQVGVVIKGDDQRPIVKAAPLMPQEVWVSLNNDGLWRSSDGGETFEKVPGVTQSLLFDFGKNPPGELHPAVYVYGKIFERPGIYRSDDMGLNWRHIDNFPHPSIGSQPGTMAADRQVFGRVYIGTHGTGIFYGEPRE